MTDKKSHYDPDNWERKREVWGVRETPGLVVGRNKKVIPPDEVQRLAAIGMKDTEICDWFGLTESTLRYNFQTELTRGRTDMKRSLRQVMFETAINGNSTMMIWLSKNYLQMTDVPQEIDNKPVLPWQDEQPQDPETLPPKEREKLKLKLIDELNRLTTIEQQEQLPEEIELGTESGSETGGQ